MLRNYVREVGGRDWKQWLPLVVHAYNDSVHTATGVSPHFFMFGQHPLTCSLLVSRALLGEQLHPVARLRLKDEQRMGERARELIAESQARRAEIVGGEDPSGKGRPKGQPAFKAGDQVWISTEAWRKSYGANKPQFGKLGPLWTGPHTIRRMVGDRAAELDLPPSYRVHPVWNIYQLRKDPRTRPLPGSRDLPVAQEFFEVDRIVAHEFGQFTRSALRQGRDIVSVLVRWKGQPPSKDEWLNVTQQTRSSFDCPDVMAAYARKLQGEERAKWDSCVECLTRTKRFRDPYVRALGQG
jgi:hypothetical protein